MEKAFKEAGWALLFSAIAVLIAVSAIALAQNFKSSEFNQFFLESWPIMLGALIAVPVLRFVIVILPPQILTVIFLSVGFFFLIASGGNNTIGNLIQDFFDNTVNVDYRSLSIAVFTILIGVILPVPRNEEV